MVNSLIPIDPDKSNSSKRSVFELLPAILKTEVMRKFFYSTVDQLYQPQSVENLVGYIGNYIKGYNKITDFYIKENTPDRLINQLSPIMISRNSISNAIEKELVYSDLINYIRFKGGIVDNHQRLFEEEYYSWQPPIDLDKFINYQNYYWIVNGLEAIEIPDATDLNGLIGLPSATITVNGNPLVLSNGVKIKPLNDVTSSYNNKSFIVEGVGTSIIFLEDLGVISGWDLNPWDIEIWDVPGNVSKDPDYFTIERGAEDKNQWSLSNRWFHKDVIKNINDANLKKIRALRPIIEFQKNIELAESGFYDRGKVDAIINCSNFYNSIQGIGPGFGAYPFDKEDIGCGTFAVSWDEQWPQQGIGFADVFIIENNQGTLWTANTQYNVGDIVFHTLTSNSYICTTNHISSSTINLSYWNSYPNIQIKDGMRILMLDDANPSIKGKILEVSNIQSSGIINLSVVNNGLSIVGDAVLGEFVTYKKPDGTVQKYWFNGVDWVKAQTKTKSNQHPLFLLYDINKDSLANTSIYQNNDFITNIGNKIFSYQEDDTSNFDAVLGIKPTINDKGNFVFVNNLVTDRYTYQPNINSILREEILGYYFYKVKNYSDDALSVYSNSWHKAEQKSEQFFKSIYFAEKNQKIYNVALYPDSPITSRNSYNKESIIVKINGNLLTYNTDYSINTGTLNNQTYYYVEINNSYGDIEEFDVVEISIFSKENPLPNIPGYYEIPINLKANANNEEVGIISRDELFDQFVQGIKNQPNFSGNELGKNNYRDTPKLRYLGGQILQNSAPLLKTMLLASSAEFDLINAIKYNQREYVRFKNKFIQKITFIRNNNLLPETNPSDWVYYAINEINLGKTNDFPFKNTGVLSFPPTNENYFIPPTPSFLGILPSYQPYFYIDDTLKNSPVVLKNHDGSITPSFDDFRDDVLLELETLIYNSIPAEFKNEELKELTKYDIIPGYFRQTSYTRDEINKILQPMFELWVAQNNLTFPTNNSSIEDDLFSINFSDCFAPNGEKLPGGWRGIYKYFYDTDSPHLRPWEMLGFTNKPSWWDTTYGVAPYTKGNALLWQDLEDGYIRNGTRQGYDIRFARPGLSNFIPVSFTGDLLNPIDAGIVKNTPINLNFNKDWVFGDGSPTEAIWYNSFHFSFDLIQLMFLTNPAKFVEFFWDNKKFNVFSKDKNYRQTYFKEFNKRITNSNYFNHDEDIDLTEDLPSNIYIENYNELIRIYGVSQIISNYLESQGKNITTKFGSYLRNTSANLGYRLSGFIDNNNLTVVSDSFGLVPKENKTVKLYKSNSVKEKFYGGVIIERSEKGFKVYGYDLLTQSFNIIPGDSFGPKVKVGIGSKGRPYAIWTKNTLYQIGDIVEYESTDSYFRCIKQHVSSENFADDAWVKINLPPIAYQLEVVKKTRAKQGKPVEKVLYGREFQNHQDTFDFLIDYERYLVEEGFIFDQYDSDANDVVDWTWSGKEFLSWVLTNPSPGDLIALSPASQKVKFITDHGYIEPVEQIIQGIYSILNRDGNRIDPKDTIVSRIDGQLELRPKEQGNPDQSLYSLRLYLSEIEHLMILDNTTIFNDTIYNPLLSIQQERLRIATSRARDWKGRYSAPGFIISEDILLPNYDKLADQIRYIFDIDKSDLVDYTWQKYGYHNIGYQERDYLDNLIISEKSQVNFYQGMIQQKGTKSSFNKLLRSNYITSVSDLLFYEEWAFRIGQYGDYDKKPSLEISFSQDSYKQNPQIVEFPIIQPGPELEIGPVTPAQPTGHALYFYNTTEKQLYQYINNQFVKTYDWDSVLAYQVYDNPGDDFIRIFTVADGNVILGGDSRWRRRPDTTVSELKQWVWPNRRNEYGNLYELPNAGYVKLGESAYYSFNKSELMSLPTTLAQSNTKIFNGENIWLYDTKGLGPTSPIIIESLSTSNPIVYPNIGCTKYYDSWTMLRLTEIYADLIQVNLNVTENTLSLQLDSHVDFSGYNDVLFPGDVIFIYPNDPAEEFSLLGAYEIIRIENEASLIVNRPINFFSNLGIDEINDLTPFKIFVLRELRFKDIDERDVELQTKKYDHVNIAPISNNTLIYVDDVRTPSQKLLIEKRYEVFSVDDISNLTFSSVRKQQPKVDTKMIKNGIIYDKETDENIGNFQIFDPYKGLIPGLSESELWYKIDFDPAKYTNGDGSIHQIDEEQAWGPNQVGRTWWDLRTVKYIEYEIEDNIYRRRYWGKTAPGSSIDVYEWVRSEVPPADYQLAAQNSTVIANIVDTTPSGQIYSEDAPAYSEFLEFDENFGSMRTFYYFWVKNKLTLPNVNFRKMNVAQIARIINDPTSEGIKWLSPINNDAVIISNLFDLLRKENTILQINWIFDKEPGNWHKQWVIGRENDSDYLPDSTIYQKIIDSIVGFDKTNKIVPDPILNETEKYGTLIRPRQTIFVNKTKARENYVEYFNYLLEKTRYNLRLNGVSSISLTDAAPTGILFTVTDLSQRNNLATSSLVSVNDLVLVTQEPLFNGFWSVWKYLGNEEWELNSAQTYNTVDFINFNTDFYSADIDKTNQPNKVFNTLSDVAVAYTDKKLSLNEIIKINDNGGNKWQWLKIINIDLPTFTSNNYEIVAEQNATISLSNKFFKNNLLYGVNENWAIYDENSLANAILNRDGSLELRALLNAFYNDDVITIEENNKIFYNIIHYAHSENQIIDWAFKTSYITFGGDQEKLEQTPISRPSLFESLVSYITEVKPYHVKFRNLLQRLATYDDLFLNMDDFDYDSADLEQKRKIKITQKFDRVSCSEEDDEPYKLRLIANGTSSNYALIVNNSTVLTIPNQSQYDVYKSNGRQIWLEPNIEKVEIKNYLTYTRQVLTNGQFNTVIVSGSPNYIELQLGITPPQGSFIEVYRRLSTADRISRFYNPIQFLWNGNPVSHIIPTKDSPGLISGCDFGGTIVEGGNYNLSNQYFQITPNNTLAHPFDIEANKKFFEENLKPLITPDGIPIEVYIASVSGYWVDAYFEDYSSTDPNLVLFGNSYGFGAGPFDGSGNVGGPVAFTSGVPVSGLLYDVILSGGKSSVSGTAWPLHNGPLDLIVEGNKFIQPYYGPKRPEELALMKFNEPYIIDVYQQQYPGSPIIESNRTVINFVSGKEFDIPGEPQHIDAIFVFLNEQLLNKNSDYSINWENKKLTILVSGNNISNQIEINTYSTGGGDSIVFTKTLRASDAITSDNVFYLDPDQELTTVLTTANTFVTLNGNEAEVSSINAGILGIDTSGNTVTANSSYIFNVYASSDIALVHREKVTKVSGQINYALRYMSGPEIPVEQSVLVFSSGYRLLGPKFKYFTGDNSALTFNTGIDLTSVSSVSVYVNQIEDTTWTIFGSSIINFTTPPGSGAEIIVRIEDDPDYVILPADYDGGFDFSEFDGSGFATEGDAPISDFVFKLFKPLASGAVVDVVTFNNNSSMKIRTEYFTGNSAATYDLAYHPTNPLGIWAAVDGMNKTFGLDYSMIKNSSSYDTGIINSCGIQFNYATLKFNDKHIKTSIGVSGFDGDLGGDDLPYDEDLFDVGDLIVSASDVYITYILGKEKKEEFAFRYAKQNNHKSELLRISNNQRFILGTEVTAKTSIITLLEDNKLKNYEKISHPLITPNKEENEPGVVWINGERIQYWSITNNIDVSGNRYWEISDLQRGTRHTPNGVLYDTSTYYFGGNGSATTFTISSLASLDINNTIVSLISFGGAFDEWDTDGWDDGGAWDFSNVQTGDLVLQAKTSALAPGDYEISGNSVIFVSAPPLDSTSVSILVSAVISGSSTFIPITIPASNIMITVINSDWEDTDIQHVSGELVLNGGKNQIIPGGFNSYYANSSAGLSFNTKSIFLKNYKGNLYKP